MTVICADLSCAELELKRMYETLNLYDDNCNVSGPQLIL